MLLPTLLISSALVALVVKGDKSPRKPPFGGVSIFPPGMVPGGGVPLRKTGPPKVSQDGPPRPQRVPLQAQAQMPQHRGQPPPTKVPSYVRFGQALPGMASGGNAPPIRLTRPPPPQQSYEGMGPVALPGMAQGPRIPRPQPVPIEPITAGTTTAAYTGQPLFMPATGVEPLPLLPSRPPVRQPIYELDRDALERADRRNQRTMARKSAVRPTAPSIVIVPDAPPAPLMSAPSSSPMERLHQQIQKNVAARETRIVQDQIAQEQLARAQDQLDRAQDQLAQSQAELQVQASGTLEESAPSGERSQNQQAAQYLNEQAAEQLTVAENQELQAQLQAGSINPVMEDSELSTEAEAAAEAAWQKYQDEQARWRIPQAPPPPQFTPVGSYAQTLANIRQARDHRLETESQSANELRARLQEGSGLLGQQAQTMAEAVGQQQKAEEAGFLSWVLRNFGDKLYQQYMYLRGFVA